MKSKKREGEDLIEFGVTKGERKAEFKIAKGEGKDLTEFGFPKMEWGGPG